MNVFNKRDKMPTCYITVVFMLNNDLRLGFVIKLLLVYETKTIILLYRNLNEILKNIYMIQKYR